MSPARVLTLVVAASVGVLLLVTAPAGGEPSNNIGVDTTLISRSTSGGLPNGPSSHPTLSLDGRLATILAFESTATDLVAQPTGGGTNVYFTRRAQPFDDLGSRWFAGPIHVASQGLGGQPANGPSTLPVIGADNRHAPACIAFLSAASNLVPGDTNGKPDAFAYFLGSGKTTRVSVTTKGKQANGAATGVAVNGTCTQFAFADDATNLAGHPPAGISQIYLRNLVAKRKITVTVRRHGRKRRIRKNVVGPLTTLVSASGRQPGNANSSAPVMAAFSNDIAFVSKATNLAGATGGFDQVYGVGPRLGALRMLSVTSGGQTGDGDSDQAAISQNARGYGFRTRAPNLGSTGPARVVYARVGLSLRGAGPATGLGQGHPKVVNQGHYVIFENGGDVDLWTDVGQIIVVLSRDSQQNLLTLPATDPTTSEVTNYAAFETNDPFADHDFADSQPGWNGDPQGTRQRAQSDPTYHQVYLRYYGGK